MTEKTNSVVPVVDSLSLYVGVSPAHYTATREWRTQKEIVWWVPVSSSRVGRRESIFGLQENENERKRKRALEDEGEDGGAPKQKLPNYSTFAERMMVSDTPL